VVVRIKENGKGRHKQKPGIKTDKREVTGLERNKATGGKGNPQW
jgi:hypothetical protein